MAVCRLGKRRAITPIRQASQQSGAASPRFVARPTAGPYAVYAHHRRCATTLHDVCLCTRRSTQRQMWFRKQN